VALAGSEIDTLEVAAGGRRAVIARDSSGVFVRVSGGNGGAEDSEINRVAANLPFVRVTGFVDDRPAITPADRRRYGLDPPSLRLSLKLRNGERRDLAFGGTGAGGVYTHRPGAGVVWLDEPTVDDLRRLAGSQDSPSTGNPR
jgi:hypothetical protein